MCVSTTTTVSGTINDIVVHDRIARCICRATRPMVYLFFFIIVVISRVIIIIIIVRAHPYHNIVIPDMLFGIIANNSCVRISVYYIMYMHTICSPTRYVPANVYHRAYDLTCVMYDPSDTTN